jgi:hypothetical protein
MHAAIGAAKLVRPRQSHRRRNRVDRGQDGSANRRHVGAGDDEARVRRVVDEVEDARPAGRVDAEKLRRVKRRALADRLEKLDGGICCRGRGEDRPRAVCVGRTEAA